MLDLVKRIINGSLATVGFEIRMKRDQERATMKRCLEEAARNGMNPATVIDVGAASGTMELYETFPDAHFLLVEPLEEFRASLQKIMEGMKKADILLGVAASRPGKITINVHQDLVGSSLFREEEDSNVNGVPRVVEGLPLNDLCKKKGTIGPYLLKIDTQGAELEVLKGAEAILPETEFVILETSLFELFKGGVLFYDCLSYMNDKGFVVYDVFDLRYRLLDGALAQVDLAFVKKDSQLRKHQFWATREQRERQNKAFGVR
jgi:FkbM family methyltransferase